MTVAEVRARARDLADVQDARWLSTTYEYNSLNESYRDIYEAISQTNEDYFLTPLVYTWSQGTKSANSNNEYFFTLPSDFYKVRTVDFKVAGRWIDMARFTLRQRDGAGADPLYRTQNKTLWIIVPPSNWTGADIRIYYYPTPKTFVSPTDEAVEIPYPTSLAPELLAYSMATDYKRRQGIPTDTLEARKNELWSRYTETLKRDDGKYEVIQNVYTSRSPWR